jgi:hypothetical protein
LTGKGKAWFDDIKITIDGKDIQEAIAFQKPKVKAELDNQFDNGSEINSIDTSKKNMDNLKSLGMIWGYLKYYHPMLQKGNTTGIMNFSEFYLKSVELHPSREIRF